jgi:two-component system CheB/CheR fusion protein
MEIPTVFVDTQLRVKRFTSDIVEVINLIPSDTGRRLGDIVTNLPNENILQDTEQVLESLQSSSKEVQTADGKWYLMKIRPYRTIENAIDGLVINFYDIEEKKRLQEKISTLQEELSHRRREHGFAMDLFDSIRDSVLVLSPDLTVEKANRTFLSKFHLKPAHVEGVQLFRMMDGAFDNAELRKLLARVLPERMNVENFRMGPELGRRGRFSFRVDARRIFHGETETDRILLIIEDVTEHSGNKG